MSDRTLARLAVVIIALLALTPVVAAIYLEATP